MVKFEFATWFYFAIVHFQNKFMQDKNDQRKKDEDSKELANYAYEQAEKDIEKDPELNSQPEPGDDLDEGELARLEGEE